MASLKPDEIKWAANQVHQVVCCSRASDKRCFINESSFYYGSVSKAIGIFSEKRSIRHHPCFRLAIRDGNDPVLVVYIIGEVAVSLFSQQ